MREVRHLWPGVACLYALLTLCGASTCKASEFSHATVVASPQATPAENKAVDVLIDEARKRTAIRWTRAEAAIPNDEPMIVAARRDLIDALLTPAMREEWNQSVGPQDSMRAEGFTLRTLAGKRRGSVLVIAGNDSRGLLFGIGYVLRKMQLAPGHAELAAPLNLDSAPQYPIRGHQIGYRFKNNTYDAFTLPMFDQHIRELALFGTNSIQLIVPDSDDAPTSPLFHAPALDTLLGVSKILADYGLDCDIYYPEMRKDYSDPATVAAELKTFEDLFRQIPRVDALYVPGGDPGHTEPKYLFPLVEQEAAILRRYHPQAQVWVSAQGFSKAWYEELYALLEQKPAWLTGVFFGPQSRDSFETQRARIPRQYPMLFYPDIAHTMHSQFPVPDWDPAYALSEGREPINPRPEDETHIYRHFAELHQGFITYSEGVNDDVNKMLWTQLGWSAKADPLETLKDYSRFFIGPLQKTASGSSTDDFANGLMALERDWSGPLLRNRGVDETLRRFRAMERQASATQRENWRFEEALYRAYYDAHIQRRLIAETQREERADAILRRAPQMGSAAAMQAAMAAMQPADPSADHELRPHLFELADALFRHIGLQLSVAKYGASGIERGANLDRVDVSLNDRVWLGNQLKEIAQLPTEEERLRRIAAVVDWDRPREGGFYDDTGAPGREPHLVQGVGFREDPEFYGTANNGIADMTPDDGWRMSWITYAENLYEVPIEMVYPKLDPRRRYKVRVTYAGEGYWVPLKLTANDRFELHPPLTRATNPMTLEFSIPEEATQTGVLDLKWTGPPGLGGSGRGHQIAEVWVIPE